jgi:hypothetical protein
MSTLRWIPRGAGSASTLFADGPNEKAARAQRLEQYYSVAKALARTDSLDPASAMRLLLVLAPTVGDPLDLFDFCDGCVDLAERLQRRDLSEQTLEVAKRVVCQVEVRRLPEHVLRQARQTRADVERVCAANRRILELEATTSGLDAQLAAFDRMSGAEKARFAGEVQHFDNSVRFAARSLSQGPRHSSRPARDRRRRSRHCGRRAPRRRSIRRAQADSGGDGDDGPEPRCGCLACKGARQLAHDSEALERSRGADV